MESFDIHGVKYSAQPCGCDPGMNWHCEQYPKCQTYRHSDAMDPECEAHLARLKSNFIADLDAKYRGGQSEHGGHVWEKPGMLEHAIEEAIDMVVYLYTLRDQRDGHHTPTGRD